MNVDTDMQYAFTHAVEEHFAARSTRSSTDQRGIDKRVYDPRTWGRKAELAMAARVVEASRQLGSVNRSIA
jgi:fructose-bisphosphate aldolase class II